MEALMPERDPAPPEKPGQRKRAFIACLRCQSRKIRCDGKTPKCSSCTASSADCIYAASRRTRGQGKSKKRIEDLEMKLERMQSLLFSSHILGEDKAVAADKGKARCDASPTPPRDQSLVPMAVDSSGSFSSLSPPASTPVQVSTQVPIPAPAPAPVPAPARAPAPPCNMSTNTGPSGNRALAELGANLFPEHLMNPEVYQKNMRDARRGILDYSSASSRKFSTLFPQAMTRHLVENTYDDILAAHPVIDLPGFLGLLDAQYAASTSDPAGNPARWALVNAVLTLAMRAKVARGSEGEMADVVGAYNRNACSVLPSLVLERPSLLSVQALLAMAIFARDTPDAPAFVMLVTNASRQLELLSLPAVAPAAQGPEGGDVEERRRLLRIARELDRDASTAYVVGSILSRCEGGGGE